MSGLGNGLVERLEAKGSATKFVYYNFRRKNFKEEVLKKKLKEMSNMQKNLMKSKLPPMVPRSAKNAPGRQKDYSPTEWKAFFHDSVDVKIEDNSFRCYRSKPADQPEVPVLVLLHGGGYNALSWAVFSVRPFTNKNMKVNV